MHSEKQQIMAENWTAFSHTWPKLWIAFGQTAPNDQNALTKDVWEQVQHIPAAAWPYILSRVRDMDSKPRNWAKTLKVLYSHWIEVNTPDTAKKEQGRKVDGPIGQRMLQLAKVNPGLSPRDRLRIAIQEYEQ